MTDIVDLGFRVDSKQLEKATKELDRLDSAGKKTTTSTKKLTAATKKGETAHKGAAKEVENLTRSYRAGKVAGAAFAAVAVASVVQFAKYETALAEVNTLFGNTQNIDKYSDAIQSLSLQFGVDTTTQAKAMYDVISSGASNAAEATAILTSANKLAIGGVTDVATAADGLTSVLNAYGLDASHAGDVSDTMFATMKAGKTTIAELSAGLGQVVPVAAQLGVGFPELSAALATLTTSGVKTKIAVTQLTAVMGSVLKPSTEAMDVAERLGLEFNSTALEADGLVPFLEKVGAATKGDADELGKLFGSLEAVKAILPLLGGKAEDFAEILEKIENRAGATDEAVSIMMATMEKRWDRAVEQVLSMSRAWGEQLAPVVSKVLDLFLEMTGANEAALLSLEGLSQSQAPERLGALAEALVEAEAKYNRIAKANETWFGHLTYGDELVEANRQRVDDLKEALSQTALIYSDLSDATGITNTAIAESEAAITEQAEALKKANDELEAYNKKMAVLQPIVVTASRSADDFSSAEQDIIISIAEANAAIQEQREGLIAAKDLFIAGKISLEEYKGQIEELGGASGEAANVGKESAGIFGDAWSDALARTILAGDNFKDYFKNLLKQLLQDILSSGISKAFAGLFNMGDGEGFSFGGGNSFGDSVSSLFSGAAKSKAMDAAKGYGKSLMTSIGIGAAAVPSAMGTGAAVGTASFGLGAAPVLTSTSLMSGAGASGAVAGATGAGASGFAAGAATAVPYIAAAVAAYAAYKVFFGGRSQGEIFADELKASEAVQKFQFLNSFGQDSGFKSEGSFAKGGFISGAMEDIQALENFAKETLPGVETMIQDGVLRVLGVDGPEAIDQLVKSFTDMTDQATTGLNALTDTALSSWAAQENAAVSSTDRAANALAMVTDVGLEGIRTLLEGNAELRDFTIEAFETSSTEGVAAIVDMVTGGLDEMDKWEGYLSQLDLGTASGSININQHTSYTEDTQPDQYRTGTPYIQQDGLAYLHKGEKVVNAANAQSRPDQESSDVQELKQMVHSLVSTLEMNGLRNH